MKTEMKKWLLGIVLFALAWMIPVSVGGGHFTGGTIQTLAASTGKVKFSKKTYSVTVGKTLKLKVKNATGDKVKKWKVNKTSIAKINKKGKLTAKKKGKVKVTAIMKSGKKATCTVKVKAKKSSSKSSSGSRSRSSDDEDDSDVVYWVPSGDVYHSTPDCRSLSRSKTIYHGSIPESGKSRACKNCW